MQTEVYNTLPNDVEAESAVVGSVVINEEVFAACYFLKMEDFYIDRHKWIWQAYGRMYKNRTPIDYLTLKQELADMGVLDEIGGAPYLTSLLNGIPNTYNAEAYARRVEEFSIRRKLITAANNIAAVAYTAGKSPEEMINESVSSVYQVADRTNRKEVTVGAALRAAYEQSRKAEKEGGMIGIPSGFVDLDSLLGGFKSGKLYYFGGRPGMGKTGLVLDFAIEAAFVEKKNVRIFSQEMNYTELAVRIAAKRLGIDTKRIEDGYLSDEQWREYEALVDMVQDHERFPLTIDETVPLNPVALHAICHNHWMRGNLDLVIIDYMQLMEGSGIGLREQVTDISRSTKRLARSMNIPVIGAAQLNRSADEDNPRLKDLQETGALEQDADVVGLLSPDDQLKDKGIMDLHIAKHRGGPVGHVYLNFIREQTKFTSSTVRKEDFKGNNILDAQRKGLK